MKRALLAALCFALPASAAPPDDPLSHVTIIYARGGSLYKSDARGKNEVELATLPAKATVRALRTDAGGKILLVDLAGKWSWLPLDGTAKALADLPCADGPAQLAEDAACVLCRAANGGQSIIINLATGKQTPIAIPAPGARIAGTGKDRKLVWADSGGVWTSPPGAPQQKKQVAPQAPIRYFTPSPDGLRAVGIYQDDVYVGGPRKKQQAEVLEGFQLDGQAVRRKGIRNGVPVEWSHDNEYVLVQDGGKACLMRAIGGQYKCWRGYIGVSLAPDGSYALLLGGRDKKSEPAKPKKKDDATETEEGGDAEDDVPVPPPTGPMSLYRAELNGPYTAAPGLVARAVDGAAVWVPQ
jgi:hypothetical protein